MDVTLPDGVVIRGVPDGTTKDQLLGKLRLAKHPSAEGLLKVMAAEQTQKDLGNTGFVEKMRAGFGKAVSDLGSGAAQLVGMGPSGEEVRETRQRDAALMNTGAGIAGNIAGNVAMLAPAAMIPGANTVAGAGAVGALTGMLQPAENMMDRGKNTAVGFGLGAGTQYATTTGAQKLGEMGANKIAELSAQKSRNAVADETLKRGRDAGYVLPPSAVSDSWLGRRLESVAGKAAIGQEAALRNQSVTDRLAREAAGLDTNAPINLTNLRAARKELSGPYRELAGMSPEAAAELEALQMARHNSKLAWKEYNRQGVRTAYHDATAADTNAARLEAALSARAEAAGNPALVDALNVSRRRIAQNHQVQSALNRGTGEVDASVIGRSLDNGAPLSGPLETIGRFQQAYKPYTREASTIPTPGVSKSEALSGALLGTAGHAAAPGIGMLAGGLPLLSGPARSLLLSDIVQEAALTPNYAPGMVTRGAAALNDPAMRQRVANLSRALVMPAIPAAVNE